MRSFYLLFISMFCLRAFAENAIYTDFQPYPGSDLSEKMKTTECRELVKITQNGGDENPINMDQFQVYKKGFLLSEYYKPGVYTKDSFHLMMSASKPVTATILDAAIQSGLKYNGKIITYETKLNEFYSYEDRLQLLKNKQPSSLSPLSSNTMNTMDKIWYNQITLKHLTNMQAGFKWDESYNNPLGDFMSALYLNGIKDIVAASLVAPMELPPGQKFNYSGGNANITQGIIQKLGIENFNELDVNKTAKRILFNKLGIKDVFYELDLQSSAIGSTYLHLTPKGMAILGHLYLNKGYWIDENGQRIQILSSEFISGLSQLNTAVDRAEISEEYLEYIKEEGAPSQSITWVNKDIYDNKGVLRYKKEFPNSPDDMFFLAGHNGQVIFVLPSQEMVIVMTGNNRGYWDKINKVAAYSVKCFSDLELAPDNNKFSVELPKKEIVKKNLFRKVLDGVVSVASGGKEALKKIKPALKLVNSPIATGVVAKELCSCMKNVLNTKDISKAIKYCPGDVPQVLMNYYNIRLDELEKKITVQSKLGFYSRTATFGGQYGCNLLPVE